MTLQRIYHSTRHCYIIADVTDAGAKPHVTPATGDEQLQFEHIDGMKRRTAKTARTAAQCDALVRAALADGPLLISAIAKRTGIGASNVERVLKRGPFVQVGPVVVHGRARPLWGLA